MDNFVNIALKTSAVVAIVSAIGFYKNLESKNTDENICGKLKTENICGCTKKLQSKLNDKRYIEDIIANNKITTINDNRKIDESQLRDKPKTNDSIISSSISSSRSEDVFTHVEIEGLLIHNELRHKHGVPELQLDRDLCDLAQEWATHCLKSNNMSHRPNNKYGENIFYAYSSDLTYTASPQEAVNSWYDEIKEYNFGIESANPNILHFSQVVWKGTKELGIGLAKNEKGETYIVANYSPRGNIIGHFNHNVPRTVF